MSRRPPYRQTDRGASRITALTQVIEMTKENPLNRSHLPAPLPQGPPRGARPPL